MTKGKMFVRYDTPCCKRVDEMRILTPLEVIKLHIGVSKGMKAHPEEYLYEVWD